MRITDTVAYGPTSGEGPGRAIVAGAVAGFLGGLIWYLIVRYTGYEIGWIAWGVGFLVGTVMSRAAMTRSKALAAQAAAFAGAGLVVGKFLIFQWASGPALLDELQKDPEMLRQVAFLELYESGDVPADLEEQLLALGDDEAWPDSVAGRVDALIDEKMSQLGSDDTAIAEAAAGWLRSDLSLVDGVIASISPFDLLWFFLAIGTAWRMLAPAKEPEPA